MLRRLIERTLVDRYPEDDAGGGGDSAPAGSADSATTLEELPFPDVPGLTDQSAGASDQQPAAGDGSDDLQRLADASAAAASGEQPAPVQLPFDDPETMQAFLDEYAATLVQHPTVAGHLQRQAQSLADQELAEREALPINDARYQAEQAREDRALADLQAELVKIDSGEAADPQVIARATLEARGAIETRTAIAAQRAADLVIDDVTTQLNEWAGRDLFTPEMRSAYGWADQQFARQQAANMRDRQGNVVPDQKARAQALPTYLKRTMQIVAAAAIEHGRGLERAQKATTQQNRELLARRNAGTQAAAAAAASRGTPRNPSAAPTKRPVLDRTSLTAGTWRDTQKLMESAGERIS